MRQCACQLADHQDYLCRLPVAIEALAKAISLLQDKLQSMKPGIGNTDRGTDTRTDGAADRGTKADEGADRGSDNGADAPTNGDTDRGTDRPIDARTDRGADRGTDSGPAKAPEAKEPNYEALIRYRNTKHGRVQRNEE